MVIVGETRSLEHNVNSPRGEWVPDPSYVLACTVGIAIKSFLILFFSVSWFFPEFSEHFLKTSRRLPDDFPRGSRRLSEGFPKISRGLPNISEDFRRASEHFRRLPEGFPKGSEGLPREGGVLPVTRGSKTVTSGFWGTSNFFLSSLRGNSEGGSGPSGHKGFKTIHFRFWGISDFFPSGFRGFPEGGSGPSGHEELICRSLPVGWRHVTWGEYCSLIGYGPYERPILLM